MVGAGKGAGEPPEQAWSQLGPLGYITKYKSLPARQFTLEKQMIFFNADKQKNMPKLLLRQHRRASEAKNTECKDLLALLRAAKEAGFNPQQVQAHKFCRFLL
jgi:hypothetical protein